MIFLSSLYSYSILFPMATFLDPFASPVPGGNRSPSIIVSKPSSPPETNQSGPSYSQYFTATPRPQSNINAFRQSTASNAETLVNVKVYNRSSVKGIDTPLAHIMSHQQPDTPLQAHVRPSTYPAASPLYKLLPHGYRFSVDAPINYRHLFRSLSTGRRRHIGWQRSWLLKNAPIFDSKIMVNTYYRIGGDTPLFQHASATISSTSSSTRASRVAAELDSVATPEENTVDDYLVELHTSFCSMQATLFVLGFLVFPCWWIGGFYCRPQGLPGSNRSSISSDSSSSGSSGGWKKRDWMTNTTNALAGPLGKNHDGSELSYSQLFHLLNRVMALLSALWLMVTISIIIWYYVGLSNGLWDSQSQNSSRLDQLNRQSKMNIPS